MKHWIDRLWERDDWVRRAFALALESFAHEASGKRRERFVDARVRSANPAVGGEPISVDTLG